MSTWPWRGTGPPGRPGPFGGLGVWVRSEWRSRWRALVGIAVIAAIGGGLTLAAAAGARRADTAVDRFIADLRGPITVAANAPAIFGPDRGLPDELASEIASLPGVRGVREFAWIGAALQADDVPLYFFSAGLGTATGDDPPTGVGVTDGRLPDPSAADEAALNSTAATALGAEIGDMIELRSYAADQLELFVRDDGGTDEGPRVQVEIVGLVESLDDLGEGADPIAYLSSGFVEAHRDDIAICDCGLFVNVAPHEHEAVVTRIQERVDANEIYVTSEDRLATELIDDAVRIEVVALWIAAAVAGLASLVVVAQAIGRHVRSSPGHRETLRALGATRGTMTRAWTVVFVPAAALGAMGAVGIAALASPLFPRGLARDAEPDPGFRFDAATLTSGAVVAACTLIAIAFISALRAAFWQPPVARRTSRSTWSPVWFPPTARLGFSLAVDPAHNRSRVAFVGAVVGVVTAVAGILAIAVVERATDDVLSTPAAYGADWDLQITVSPSDPEALIAATLELPIDALALQTSTIGRSFVVHGPSASTSTQPIAYDTISGAMGPFIDEGRPLTDEHDVVLSRQLADRLGVGIGDDVRLEPGAHTFRVSGLGRTYNDNDSTDATVVVTSDGLRRLNDGDEPQVVGAFVRSGEPGAATVAALHGLGWVTVTPPAQVGNLDQIGSVPRLLAAGLTALGFAAVLNVLFVAIKRRGADLAVSRALGFTSAQTVTAIVWQTIAIAAVGLIVGVPLGVLLGRLVWKRIIDGVGAVDLASVPWSAVVVVPTTTLTVMLLIGIGVGRRAARIEPIRVLRRE